VLRRPFVVVVVKVVVVVEVTVVVVVVVVVVVSLRLRTMRIVEHVVAVATAVVVVATAVAVVAESLHIPQNNHYFFHNHRFICFFYIVHVVAAQPTVRDAQTLAVPAPNMETTPLLVVENTTVPVVSTPPWRPPPSSPRHSLLIATAHTNVCNAGRCAANVVADNVSQSMYKLESALLHGAAPHVDGGVVVGQIGTSRIESERPRHQHHQHKSDDKCKCKQSWTPNTFIIKLEIVII
jgi:hypothetical protein